jgi:hypothetical protein
MKNLDWEARRIIFEAKAPAEVLADVRACQSDSGSGWNKALTNFGAQRRVVVHACLLPYTQPRFGSGRLSSIVKTKRLQQTA